ncbi:hypothetical protein FWH58_03775, partial [Candidatus Saccharibacteria bacterium]|nr:hypothetical protein [Candidatus Saccharibacteria bacterium]
TLGGGAGGSNHKKDNEEEQPIESLITSPEGAQRFIMAVLDNIAKKIVGGDIYGDLLNSRDLVEGEINERFFAIQVGLYAVQQLFNEFNVMEWPGKESSETSDEPPEFAEIPTWRANALRIMADFVDTISNRMENKTQNSLYVRPYASRLPQTGSNDQEYDWLLNNGIKSTEQIENFKTELAESVMEIVYYISLATVGADASPTRDELLSAISTDLDDSSRKFARQDLPSTRQEMKLFRQTALDEDEVAILEVTALRRGALQLIRDCAMKLADWVSYCT